MKYERMTKETVGSFGYDLKDFEHKPKEFNDYDAFFAYKMAGKRLGELEEKKEAGTLVEVPKGAVVLTPEERAEEMRLFNEKRKQAVIEFAVRLKKKADSYNYDENYINRSVMYTDIDDLVTEVCRK